MTTDIRKDETWQSIPAENIPSPAAAANPAMCSTPKSPNSHGETIAKVGTIFSAILASSCCWLPLLLLAVGVSGAGIAAALATYRPLFIGITVVFLSAAFYFTYRPKRAAAGVTDCCAGQPAAVDCCGNPIVATVDCCAPSAGGKRRFNMMSINKVMLWGVTAFAAFFIFFPGYMASWISNEQNVVTGNMHRVVLRVEGMTCEGCAPIAVKALRKIDGVLAAEVDYSKQQAIVGIDPARSVAEQSLLGSLESVGFQGQIVKD